MPLSIDEDTDEIDDYIASDASEPTCEELMKEETGLQNWIEKEWGNDSDDDEYVPESDSADENIEKFCIRDNFDSDASDPDFIPNAIVDSKLDFRDDDDYTV